MTFSDLAPGHVCALVLLDVAPVLSIFSQITFLLLLWGACPASLPFRLSPGLLLAASCLSFAALPLPRAVSAAQTQHLELANQSLPLLHHISRTPQPSLLNPNSFFNKKNIHSMPFSLITSSPLFSFLPPAFPFAPRHPFSLPSHLHKNSF